MLGLLIGVGLYALKKTIEVNELKMALAMAGTKCPADQYPGDAGNCGSDGPACGNAVWTGSTESGKCRVPELKTTPGCNVCYEGQVTPCLRDDYRKACSGHSDDCGVRYCINVDGGWDYEDLCRFVGDAGP
jgi:hypothetical protein